MSLGGNAPDELAAGPGCLSDLWRGGNSPRAGKCMRQEIAKAS